jgi:hypothetical protein
MAIAGSRTLRGRSRERERLDRALRSLREGQYRVLVLGGGVVVGKTAMLKYIGGQASDCHVARFAGVETETELSFAALHRLCGRSRTVRRGPIVAAAAAAGRVRVGDGKHPGPVGRGLAVLSLLAGALPSGTGVPGRRRLGITAHRRKREGGMHTHGSVCTSKQGNGAPRDRWPAPFQHSRVTKTPLDDIKE